MSKRDRDYGGTIAARVLSAVGEDAPMPERGELAARGAALSKLGEDVVYAQHQWVDPAICRPASVNARDYDALTFDDCAELIDTIKSEGKQRVPAIVRPTDDPEVPYEVIAGLRRHWAITWLRANNYPDFKYLIYVQRMDDEAAFRLSDLENRARTDITDLERGRSYKTALTNYYGGDYEQMAERIGLSSRNLRRYIQLADLDGVIITALGGHRAAGIRHAQAIRTEANKSTAHTERLLAAAADIADEQGRRAGAGEGAIPAPDVVKRLIAAANDKGKRVQPRMHDAKKIEASNGKPMIEFVEGTSRTAATIKLLPKTGATRDEMREAVLKLVDQFFEARQ